MAEDIIGGPILNKSEALQKYEVKAKKSRFWKRALIVDLAIIFVAIILKNILKENEILTIDWYNILGLVIIIVSISSVWFNSFKISKSFDVKRLTLTAKYLEDKIAYQNKRRWGLVDRLEAFKKQGITASYDKHENLVKKEVQEKLKLYGTLKKEIKELVKEYFGKEI